MKRLLSGIVRGGYIVAVACAGVFLGFHFGQRTPWFKDFLGHRLIVGSEPQQVRIASKLVELRAEKQLLEAMQADRPPTRAVAKRALEYMWFNAAGPDAYRRIEFAYREAEKSHYDEALRLLDCLVKDSPQFAEAWNQRASIYWQLGDYERSMADSRRALALNPRHYGAWQGLAVRQMKLMQYQEAIYSLQKALELLPHDIATREALKECQEAVRKDPRKPSTQPVYA